MNDRLPPIYFYIPSSEWPESGMPENLDSCKLESFRLGAYSWTLQTYLYLKADGFPCFLTGDCPTEGIVFAGRSAFPEKMQPGARLLAIVHQGDKWRHPYAQLHVVQNRQDSILMRPSSLWQGYYMRHWPQPGLIPRDGTRGSRFENIGYFGRVENLAAELRAPSWQDRLSGLGLRWQGATDPQDWNDYSNVDALLAVRKFDPDSKYYQKPATKLFQAWHAGVPAILGCESAYQGERQSELDYIEVSSAAEAIAALKRLRDDREFRQAMVENGRIRAEETKPERLVVEWRHFFTKVAVPAYEHWRAASGLTRKIFLLRRDLALEVKNRRKNWQQVRNYLGIRSRMRSIISR